MTVNVEVTRQAEAPGAVAWRILAGPPRSPSARRQRDVILIVILLAAAVRSARLAKAAGAQISRVPDRPPQSRPVSRQRAVILIVALLAVKAELAPMAMFAIVLAAIRGLVRDNEVIPRMLSWYFGPAPAWYVRRRKRRHLRQQMLDASSG